MKTSVSVCIEDPVEYYSDWRLLLARSQADTIFSTPEWYDLWWHTLGAPSEVEAHSVSIRRDGQLVGVAQLAASDGRVGFAGGEEIADYLDIVALPGYEGEVAGAVLDHLGSTDWNVLELRNLRADAVALTYLAPEARARGLAVETEQEDVSPRMALPTDWASYLAGLSKKDRHELRRKLRRLDAAGQVSWYAMARAADEPEAVDDFIRLHRLSNPDKAQFMTSEMEEWFRAIVRSFEPLGWLKLYFLELDNRRIATAICFVYRGEYLLYNSGYDPDYSRLSAGLALKAYCIHDAIANGHRAFDFLQGDEPYKRDLGGVAAPIYRIRTHRH